MNKPKYPPMGIQRTQQVTKNSNGVIIGTCKKLEKDYFRLKEAPNPDEVRSEKVLEKAFLYVLGKYKKNHDYDYINNQLKSIRQDLSIQLIEDKFSMEIYETHAEIALEFDDISEFQQCVSALKKYYKRFKNPLDEKVIRNRAYELLCSLKSKDIQNCNVYFLIRDIPPEAMHNKDIQFVLKIKRAFDNDNFFEVFKLYRNANSDFKHIVKHFLTGFRNRCLNALIYTFVDFLILFDESYL